MTNKFRANRLGNALVIGATTGGLRALKFYWPICLQICMLIIVVQQVVSRAGFVGTLQADYILPLKVARNYY